MSDVLGDQKLVNEGSGVGFLCPNCGKSTIQRTKHERSISAKYVCPSCGFEGPN